MSPSGYEVLFDGRAWDELTQLPEEVQLLIYTATEELETDPRPPGVIRLSRAANLYCVRVENYHITYQVRDDVLLVMIISDRTEMAASDN